MISPSEPHKRINSPHHSLVLAIETSCDETAIAILKDGRHLLASEISSQIPLHRPYGGVVPEVASRRHLELIRPVLKEAFQKANITPKNIDLCAATSGPGLASSLLIGSSLAKGLSMGLGKPFLAVNHLEGHLVSPFFGKKEPIPHCVGLIVSGGHTLLVEVQKAGKYKLLGKTRDDASGEAFDKAAKLLGLPYPGGPEIDRLARDGDPRSYDFPRSMMHSDDLDFSFSGLKTSIRYLLPKLEYDAVSQKTLANLCASFQEAIVDVLVHKALQAIRQTPCQTLAVSGGVSCNRRLRFKLTEACTKAGIELLLASPELSTDNAAMIAFAASLRFAQGETTSIETDINPNLSLI